MIVIEGLIGVGKTTLGNILSKELEVPFYSELNNDFTLAVLDKFYKDKSRWAFPVQINFLNERFKLIKGVFRTKGGILDRSIYGDCVFASLLNCDGHISDEEYKIYIDRSPKFPPFCSFKQTEDDIIMDINSEITFL